MNTTTHEKPKYKNFGEFLVTKRREKELPSAQITDTLDISPGYYCDIEKNRRNPPPNRTTLENMVRILGLSGKDVDTFYDLAGKARCEAPPDLPEYINENQVVRVALRRAKDIGDEDDWQKFIYALKNKKAEGG